MKFKWDATVEEIAAENMELCAEIQECRMMLSKWKNRLAQLVAQHHVKAQPAALHRNPGLWHRLKRHEKWNQENVKAVLTSPKLKIVELPNLMHDWSNVPQPIRENVELFLLRVQQEPSVGCIPESMLNNRGVLMSLIKSHPWMLGDWLPSDSFVWRDVEFYKLLWTLLPNNNFIISLLDFESLLTKFDFGLRNNPDLIPTIFSDATDFFCWRVLLDSCHADRPKPDSPLLRNRKSVATHMLKKKGELLRCFSRRLKDDFSVVLAAVKSEGNALRFASFRLRRDPRIVNAALANDPRSLVYALDRKKRVRAQLKCSLAFFQHQPRLAESKMYRAIWKLMPLRFKENETILIAALACGVTIEDSLQQKIPWRKAVQMYPSLWGQAPGNRDMFLPSRLQCIGDVLIAIHEFPLLSFNREFWYLVARSGLLNLFLAGFDTDVPDFVMRDKEIVVECCRHDHEFLEELGQGPLSVDRDVLEAAFANSPQAVLSMTGNAQMLHPDLVAVGISSFSSDRLWDIFDDIDEDIWSNREVAAAWITSGGDFLQDEFPDEFEDDEELFLLVAEHGPQDFWYASEALCANREFMAKVIDVNPMLFHEASSELSTDQELALKAFAADSNLPGSYDMNNKEDFAFITAFATSVRSKIRCHCAFFELMGGIQFGNSELRKLNQGLETCTALKKLMGEFVGVPAGEELSRLRGVSLHLSMWGY